MSSNSKSADRRAFDAWCNQHQCPPMDCFDIHNPQHEAVKAAKRNAVSLCEHDNPVDTCIKCRHERLQIENYGVKGNGPEPDQDDRDADSDAAEVSGAREATTQTTGGS